MRILSDFDKEKNIQNFKNSKRSNRIWQQIAIWIIHVLHKPNSRGAGITFVFTPASAHDKSRTSAFLSLPHSTLLSPLITRLPKLHNGRTRLKKSLLTHIIITCITTNNKPWPRRWGRSTTWARALYASACTRCAPPEPPAARPARRGSSAWSDRRRPRDSCPGGATTRPSWGPPGAARSRRSCPGSCPADCSWPPRRPRRCGFVPCRPRARRSRAKRPAWSGPSSGSWAPCRRRAGPPRRTTRWRAPRRPPPSWGSSSTCRKDSPRSPCSPGAPDGPSLPARSPTLD